MSVGANIFGSTSKVPKTLHGGVVAIGNFDGVHLGHMEVLEQTLKLARSTNVPALVLTFEPHPRTWFNPDKPVFRLTSDKIKAKLLLEMGFDGVINENFDEKFAATTAVDFIEKHLVEDLSVSHIVTGFNFYFGARRSGSPEVMKHEGKRLGFDVSIIEAVENLQSETVSSSLVRQMLRQGDIKRANNLLGRKWQVGGTVVKGAQLGRTLGFPTANLKLSDECELKHGIYAVQASLENGETLNGVASFGRRPTFDNGAPLLETFIFDFDREIYDEGITISFVDWIRPEVKFETADDLVVQMNKDTDEARNLLEKLT